MLNSFYSAKELNELGLKQVGKNVKISRFVRFYGVNEISIGNNVRIDDFCILSGKITLMNNIHISAYCGLYGSAGIIMEDNTGLSPRSTLFSTSDDFSGDFLIGPQHPIELTNVIRGEIKLSKYVQLGASTIVMPGVVISEGTVTGAMSFVNRNLESWGIYVGTPAKKVKARSKNLLNLFNE